MDSTDQEVYPQLPLRRDSRLVDADHWFNVLSEAWLTLANDYAFWLLPLALAVLWPVLQPRTGTDFLGRHHRLLTVSLVMAWSCWLFPLGRMAWTAYLASHGILSEDIPNHRWPYAGALLLAIPLGWRHAYWALRRPHVRLTRWPAGVFALGGALGVGLAALGWGLGLVSV